MGDIAAVDGAAGSVSRRLISRNRVLEMIAAGAPLAETLSELMFSIEAQARGVRCGILIVTEDGAHFRRGIGPSLPEAYHAALDGVAITPPYLDACGEAAHACIPVTVPDIASDTRYAESWRNLARSCGLAAVRSIPVCGSEGRALASFAMYYDRPQDPMPAKSELMEIATHLAAIALQRQRDEDALRANERRLRDILEALPAAVYTTDAAGRIEYYNQAAADVAGRRPELGSDQWCVSWRLYWPDGRLMPHDECPMAVALREDRTLTGDEIIAERPDGSHVPLLAYPMPLHDSSGALVGAVNMLVDISERKRAEAEQQRILSIVEHSDDAIVSRDLDGVITSWNGGAERLLGYTAEEIIGRSVTILIPPDRADEEPRILASIRRGEPIDHFETVRRRKDGSLVPVSETSSPVADAQGRIIGASKISRDITERKRSGKALRESEERLRRLNEDLEQRVREEVAAREQTRARLVQAERMEALGQLAGGIAHDFNNVLQSISSGVRLLARRANDPEVVEELVGAMADAAERGASVTRRLLTFARRAELQTERVDAARLLKELREILAHSLGGGITIRVEAADGLV
ncbi:MAG: PAS domain-containing sensor histidine kinase, partial [Acetobacteraceae bacterium]